MKKFFGSWKSKAFRVGGYSVAASAIVLAIAIVVNLLVNALPATVTQFDMTSNQLFSITEQTELIMQSVDTDITFYWVVRDGYQDTNIEKLLDQYEALSDCVSVKHIDPNVYPTFTQGYTTSGVNENSVIVDAGDRFRVVDYTDIYVYDYSNYYYDGTYSVEFSGESALTAAVHYVISEDLPKVYVLTGHGEYTLSDTFSSAVADANIELEELNLLTLDAVPDDADAVLIYAPQTDISVEERNKLMVYLQLGGSMMLLTNPPQGEMPANINSMMSYYGVSMLEGVVVEGSQTHYAFSAPYYLLPDLQNHTVTAPLINNGYYVLIPIGHAIVADTAAVDTVTVNGLLTTSDSAFSKIAGYAMSTYEKEDGDIDGPFAMGVAITDDIDDDTQSRIVWVGSAGLVDDDVNSRVSNANLNLFINSLNWMCEQGEETISIRGKSMSYDYLTMDAGVATLLSVLVIGVIPLGYLAIGIVIWIRRKRR